MSGPALGTALRRGDLGHFNTPESVNIPDLGESEGVVARETEADR